MRGMANEFQIICKQQVAGQGAEMGFIKFVQG